MKLEAGKCLVCGRPMFESGRPLPCYSEMMLTLEGQTKFQRVGICSVCEIEDLEELSEVLKRDCRVDVRVVSVGDRFSYSDVLKRSQSGKCFKCGEDVGETWIQSNGVIQHESCKECN